MVMGVFKSTSLKISTTLQQSNVAGKSTINGGFQGKFPSGKRLHNYGTSPFSS